MRSTRRVVSLVAVAVVVGVMAASAFGAVSWGSAIEAPGTAALNVDGFATVNSISCTVASTCAAGGYYTDSSNLQQAFVADETSGTWGNAVEVPDAAALNHLNWQVTTISCASAGNCAAGGHYDDVDGFQQAFVVNEASGTWGNAIEVPGTAALNHYSARVTAISCASAGNCAAGGTYQDAPGGIEVFVVNEKNGVWGAAIEVPGTASLNVGGNAFLNSISCGSAGNCAAGGSYLNGSYHAFVVSSKGGVWGKAIKVPGTAALNVGGTAQVNSVSCAGAKACAAGGTYWDVSAQTQSFVVSATMNAAGKWVWAKAIIVPGTAAALHVAGFANLTSISCRSATSCSAGGQFSGPAGNQAFVVNRTKGVWGKAKPVPGLAGLGGSSTYSTLVSLSCASAGNCAATGYYNGDQGVWVAAASNGVWGNATALAGLSALTPGVFAQANSISCGKAGTCAVGGNYFEAGGFYQAFVTTP